MCAAKKRLTTSQKAFLAAFEACGNVTTAAASAGVSRSSHYYRWLKQLAYAEAFEESKKIAGDGLLSVARRRGVDGRDEESVEEIFENRKDENGEVVPMLVKRTIRKTKKVSDSLLMWLLNHFHGNPAQSHRVEIAGHDGAEPKISIETARAIHEMVSARKKKEENAQ